MTRPDLYIDVRGREWSLAGLDGEERALVADLQERARTHPDWNDFDNYWSRKVTALYDQRGVPRSQTVRCTVFKIAQDLSGRIGIAAGYIRPSDYRDELDDLIRNRFSTRQEFCEATGLSDEELGQVLARRKHLSIEILTQALERIGYTVRIAPRTMETLPARNGVQEKGDS